MQIKDILSRNYVEVSLCILHHPCSLVRNCISGGGKFVFDFDQVTKDYRQRKKMPSCASVDALTENKDTIYFVEMKGWKDFLDHTANISEYKIQKQAAKYIWLINCLVALRLVLDYYVMKREQDLNLISFLLLNVI